MLNPATCVGLRYGPILLAFLGAILSTSLCPKAQLYVLFRQYVAASITRHFYCRGVKEY